jgi:hypothetical protein
MKVSQPGHSETPVQGVLWLTQGAGLLNHLHTAQKPKCMGWNTMLPELTTELVSSSLPVGSRREGKSQRQLSPHPQRQQDPSGTAGVSFQCSTSGFLAAFRMGSFFGR